MQTSSSTFSPKGSQLAHEYEELGRLFELQPVMTRHFLDSQAGSILAALESNVPRIRFLLPDRIVLETGESVLIPEKARARKAGGMFGLASRSDRGRLLLQSLSDLESSLNPALSLCGRLFRYSLAHALIHTLLPDGNAVDYRLEAGDEIPSIPISIPQPASMLAGNDAMVEADRIVDGWQQVPFVDAARRFYLPQWVAFGEDDCLLARSMAEAKATIASLRNAVHLLEEALELCPPIAADPAYQRKRAGLLGQLVNQGRALARAETGEIIARIRQRATAGSLNRGLSLSLPYFDDENLTIKTYPVEVIPQGRIVFIPAFVVRAMRQYKKQVRGDMHLSQTTRNHLLAELSSIESAFNGHS